MSKYQPLSQRLQQHSAPEWRASFTEIEEVLGFPLPKTARTGKAWWSADSDKSHVKAWAGEGWQADVDHGEGMVTFRKSGISPAAVEAAAGLQPVGDLSDAAAPEVDIPPAPYAAPDAPALAEGSTRRSPAKATDKPTFASRFTAMPKGVGIAAMAASAAVVVGLGGLIFRGLSNKR